MTDRIIVKLRDRRTADRNLPVAALNRLHAATGVPLTHIRPMSGEAHVMGLPKKISLDQAWVLARQLMQDPNVEYAEPDRWMQAQLVPVSDPTDALYARQWNLQGPAHSPGGANIREAWNMTTGSPALTIAVIDTGLRPHEDLPPSILNGNGRIAPGYDFISDPDIGNDGDGRDADPTDPGDWYGAGECTAPAKDSSWHGTHVAGIIGALSNNRLGMTGINWRSKILPVRVLGKCGGVVSDIADAMRWAAGLPVNGVPDNPNPARVLNLSLSGSGGCGKTYQDAINAVIAVNAVVVVAAGNLGMDAAGSAPANCDGVIAVGATGPAGARAYYSNFGQAVKIFAPGGDVSASSSGGILSTLNAGTSTPGVDTYGNYQGTSMAAPHVAGIVSLMLSINPSLTPRKILELIQATARSVTKGAAQDCTIMFCGMIDAAAAVAASNPVFPGILQFTANSARVSEASGAINLSVARIGGATGSASVAYFTVDGTAAAGRDYVSTSGILNWADGDASPKVIVIPVLRDRIAEADETFTVQLSAPKGAFQGSMGSITVTVLDPDAFPQNGLFPSGWQTPSGADAGWTVANDAVSEGVFSLKSGPISHGQKAQVEVTRPFLAGTVRFTHRVSSETGWDSLRFYIDGVKQGEWSGEESWSPAAYPLSEGSHTLRWSYEKDPDCCSVGEDAAWIDEVSLPREIDASFPGRIQFAEAALDVSETAGAVTVSVSRSIGAAGAASVAYSTANATATAGSDYTATAGRLTWADGESGTKTIVIPIANDGIAEPGETFTVKLAAPQGALAGNINAMTVTIQDPDVFPPGGAFPSGWIVPAAANAGWSVASDSSSERLYSLKSDPIGNGQKAQVQITRLFSAGPVSFTRRISSASSAGTLRFYIDDVKQGEWSGEDAWFSYRYFSLTAGTHTLRWSYEKDPGCCIGGNDAAWIDMVSLPPEMVAPSAPVIDSIAAGPGSMTIGFTVPAGNGGDIVMYTASCSAAGQATRTASAGSSPITVFGLTPSVRYSCWLSASNAAGTGASSASKPGMPMEKTKDLMPIFMLLFD